MGAIVSGALHMNLSAWPFAARAAVNVACLADGVLLMLLIVLRPF